MKVRLLLTIKCLLLAAGFLILIWLKSQNQVFSRNWLMLQIIITFMFADVSAGTSSQKMIIRPWGEVCFWLADRHTWVWCSVHSCYFTRTSIYWAHTVQAVSFVLYVHIIQTASLFLLLSWMSSQFNNPKTCFHECQTLINNSPIKACFCHGIKKINKKGHCDFISQFR